jgi:uncharacterized membrane protein
MSCSGVSEDWLTRERILFLGRDSNEFFEAHATRTSESPRRDRMTPHKSFHLKTYLLIAVMIIAGPLGNVLLGKGMKQVGEFTVWPPSQLLHAGLNIFSTGAIWLGIASLITFFVAYMLSLSQADYSFVQPASSLAYGVVALLGYWMLGEKVSPLRWVGIVVICLGVFAVSRTNPRTTNPEPANLGTPNPQTTEHG